SLESGEDERAEHGVSARIDRPLAALPVADELSGHVEDMGQPRPIDRKRLAQVLEGFLVADARPGQLDRHPDLEQLEVTPLDDGPAASLALLRRQLGGEAVAAGV